MGARRRKVNQQAAAGLDTPSDYLDTDRIVKTPAKRDLTWFTSCGNACNSSGADPVGHPVRRAQGAQALTDKCWNGMDRRCLLRCCHQRSKCTPVAISFEFANLHMITGNIQGRSTHCMTAEHYCRSLQGRLSRLYSLIGGASLHLLEQLP